MVATIFLSRRAFITLQFQIELCRVKCIKLLVHISCFAVNPKKPCISLCITLENLAFTLPFQIELCRLKCIKLVVCIPCFAVNPRKPYHLLEDKVCSPHSLITLQLSKFLHSHILRFPLPCNRTLIILRDNLPENPNQKQALLFVLLFWTTQKKGGGGLFQKTWLRFQKESSPLYTYQRKIKRRPPSHLLFIRGHSSSHSCSSSPPPHRHLPSPPPPPHPDRPSYSFLLLHFLLP